MLQRRHHCRQEAQMDFQRKLLLKPRRMRAVTEEEGRGRWSHKTGSPPLLFQQTLPPMSTFNTLSADLILEHSTTISDNQNLPDSEARDGSCRGDSDLLENKATFYTGQCSETLQMQREQHKASLLMMNRQETNISFVTCS